MLSPDAPLVLMQHGGLDNLSGKTGLAMLRYRRGPIVAVIDPAHAGADLATLTGIPRPVPVVADMAAALAHGPAVAVVGGLVAFAVVFAMNSSIHSYLVLATSDADAVSLNVGFYYMANAAGRLLGTLLSGALFLVGGLPLCLWASSALVALAWLTTQRLKTA